MSTLLPNARAHAGLLLVLAAPAAGQASFLEPYLVKDLRPGATSSSPGELVAAGGLLYFTVDDPEVSGPVPTKPGRWVAVSDGVQDGLGTHLLTVSVEGMPKAHVDEAYYTFEEILGVRGSEVLFGTRGSVPQLWHGSGDGVQPIFEFLTSPGPGPRNFELVGDDLYFDQGDPGANRLYRTDATLYGTYPIGNCFPPPSEEPQNIHIGAMGALGGSLIFGAQTGYGIGQSLWNAAGSCATKLAVGNFREVDSAGGTAFAYTSNVLWMSDGTPEGTAPDVSFPGGIFNLASAGDRVYFSAHDGTSERLWSSDGQVTEPVPGSPTNAFLDVNKWLVAGDDAFLRSAGGGTKTVYRLHLPSGQMSYLPGSFAYTKGEPEIVAAGGRVFVLVWGDNSHEILIYNPATESLDVVPTPDVWVHGEELAAAGNKVYFSGTGGGLGTELWALEVPYAEAVVRLGSPPNPPALESGPGRGPVLGQVWSPRVDHSGFAPGAVIDVLAVSTSTANVPTPNGTLLCGLDPGTLYFVAAPGEPFAVDVPDDSSLLGLELCSQAASLDGQQAWHSTNALDITLGAP